MFDPAQRRELTKAIYAEMNEGSSEYFDQEHPDDLEMYYQAADGAIKWMLSNGVVD